MAKNFFVCGGGTHNCKTDDFLQKVSWSGKALEFTWSWGKRWRGRRALTTTLLVPSFLIRKRFHDQTEATRSTIECPDSTAPVSLQGHALLLPSNGRCYRTTMDPFAQSSSLHFSWAAWMSLKGDAWIASLNFSPLKTNTCPELLWIFSLPRCSFWCVRSSPLSYRGKFKQGIAHVCYLELYKAIPRCRLGKRSQAGRSNDSGTDGIEGT